MQTRHSGLSTKWRFGLFWAVAVVVSTTLWIGPACPAENSKEKSKSGETAQAAENEPIQITANQLISDNEAQYAEFIGDVKATQGDFVIISDKLRIYYTGDLLNAENKSGSDEQLKKIIATGNVKINSAQYDAETEEAEYDTAAMTVVLTGENSKVISGKNSITGSKITLYRRDGRVKVEGSKKTRVKAVFYSEGNVSDAFKMDKPQQ